jgi:hypothetical protein
MTGWIIAMSLKDRYLAAINALVLKMLGLIQLAKTPTVLQP